MQNSIYTILIVEDDSTIATLLKDHLDRWGFHVVISDDFADIMGTYRRTKPNLTLLDISLPYYNGYYWCTEIRKESQAPILFLSSHAENTDVVMAVNMGGDDYVIKPFSMDVLIAKINALMRRAYGYSLEPQRLFAQDAVLDIGEGVLMLGETCIDLTRNESRMLRMLMERKNNVVTRAQLMNYLWDDEHFIDENTLSVNINRLRKKLSAGGLKLAIETKKNEGYIIRD